MHPYYQISPQFWCFFLLSICLLFFSFNKRIFLFSRRLLRWEKGGIFLLSLCFLWIYFLLSPVSVGIGLDFAEFNPLKPLLRGIVLSLFLLLIFFCKEFLFIRGLGLLLLLLAHPILASVFLNESSFSLVPVILAYGMIIEGMVYIIWPYLYRDIIDWILASSKRLHFLRLYHLLWIILIIVAGFNL